MTVNICKNHAWGTSTPTEQVPPGYCMVAVSGHFDGGMVELLANVGTCSAALATFSAPGTALIWVPRCTISAVVHNGSPSTIINAAAASVATKLTPCNPHTRLKLAGII